MLDFINGVFNALGEFLNNIKELIFAAVDIINVAISFVPSPFREITLAFCGLVIGIIIYKVVRN